MKATGGKADLLTWEWRIERPKDPPVDYLIAEAHAIIDRAFREHHAVCMLPLFSGGNDSACACHVASLHPQFAGNVYTINTRTGAHRTKQHQRRVCRQFGWQQIVGRSYGNDIMEAFAREKGLPGPGMHTFVFARIKQRVLRVWAKSFAHSGRPVGFVSGVRYSESTRRVGYASEIQRGAGLDKSERIQEPKQLWVAPIFHWTTRDKITYQRHFGIPQNPFTGSGWEVSGECCCGAFAEPEEKELIQRLAPDVARKIARLERIAREHGKHDRWGERPSDDPKIEGPIPQTCQSCYARTLFASEA